MRYSIRKTSLGVGSVLLGTTLVSMTAHAEEVSVLPESESVVAEAAAEEAEVVTSDVVEDTPIEESEEVPALYTAAGMDSDEMPEEDLPEVEVPVITDSASDGVNESGFEITESSARIIDHKADSDRSGEYDVVEYTLGIKIPKDFNFQKPINIDPRMVTDKLGEKTPLRLRGGLSKEPKDIVLNNEVVGVLTESSIQFNEAITKYVDRSVSVTIRDDIKSVYTSDGSYGDTVSLPLDLYINNRFATRVMMDRKIPKQQVLEKDRTNVYYTVLNGYGVDNTLGEPLLLNSKITFGYDEVPDSGPVRLRLTLPEGLSFFDGGAGLDGNLETFAFFKDNQITNYEGYVISRQIEDVFDVETTSDGIQSATFTVNRNDGGNGSQKSYFHGATVAGIYASVTDYSKVRFETRSDGSHWAILDNPVELEILNGDIDRGRHKDPKMGLLLSEYRLPNDSSITPDGKLVTTKQIKTEEPIPYKTETRQNPNLAEGERKVVQKGSEGLREIAVDVTYENGVEVSRGEGVSKVVKEAVNEIIEVGTGATDTRRYTQMVDEIPYKTETRENPDLPEGERKVIQEGENGKTLVTLEVDTLNGEDHGEPREIDREVIDPVNEIIEVGTKVVTEEIPFDTEERENSELPEGERKVIQEGKPGLKNKTTGEVIEEPINEIVEIGTGIVTEDIPFDTEERENPDLPEGERRVVQEGKPGKKNVTTGEIIDEPVKEIIEIGTGIVTEDIPFETEERGNPDLPEGERRVVQEGKPGKKNVTTGEVIDEPVNEIVEIGTGKVSDLTPLEPAEEIVGDLTPLEPAEEIVGDLTPLEPAEEVIEATELVPAEKAEDAAELIPAEKAQDAAELTPAEKAQDAAELTPAEKAQDAAELEPSFQEAPEVVEDAPEVVEAAPEVVETAPIAEANALPETGETDDLALLGLASLGLLAGTGLVMRRPEED